MATRIDIPQSAVLDKNGRLQREWQQFFLLVAAAGAAAGTGTVTNAAALTAGQVVIGGGGNAILSLGAGTDTYVLTMVGGIPTWTAAGAGSGTVTHTPGPLTQYAVAIGNGAADLNVLASLGTAGQVLTSAGAGSPPVFASPSGGAYVRGAQWDGGAIALTAGTGGASDCAVFYHSSPAYAAGTITLATIVADASASATIEVWKKNGSPPTVADKISGATPLTLTAAQSSSTSSFAGFSTTAVAVGDYFAFKVATISGALRLGVSVEIV